MRTRWVGSITVAYSSENRCKLLQVPPLLPVVGSGIFHPACLMEFPDLLLSFFEERSSGFEVDTKLILEQTERHRKRLIWVLLIPGLHRQKDVVRSFCCSTPLTGCGRGCGQVHSLGLLLIAPLLPVRSGSLRLQLVHRSNTASSAPFTCISSVASADGGASVWSGMG